MHGNNWGCLQALKKYLEDESIDKKKQPFDTSNFHLECKRVRYLISLTFMLLYGQIPCFQSELKYLSAIINFSTGHPSTNEW